MNRGNTSINALAASATLHCLAGCAIGQVLGMVIGEWLHLPHMASFALAIGLAFLFGYSLSILPVIRSGIAFKKAVLLVLASDTLSIATLEITDNLVMDMVSSQTKLHIGCRQALDQQYFKFSLSLLAVP